VVTIPPKVDNLFGFDLDLTELGLFGQFGNSGYYTGLLRNTGIPDNLSVNNIGQGTPYNLPVLPGVYETRHEVMAAAKHAAQRAMAQPGSTTYVDENAANAYPQSMLF